MCYIGSSVNIGSRFHLHFSNLRKGSMTHFHVALRAFGVDAFDFSVIEECPKERLLDRERFYIAFFDAASDNGFNTRSEPNATYSAAKSPMTRRRIGDALRGREFSKDHRDRISAARSGTRLSIKHRASISEGMKGRVFRPESIAKQLATRAKKAAVLGPLYKDCRKAIVATDRNGSVIHVYESLLDAVAGLETPNSSLRYYLRTGKVTPRGMLLYYAVIERHSSAS